MDPSTTTGGFPDDPLMAAASAAWQAAVGDFTVSGSQTYVSHVLAALGEAHVVEHRTPDNLFSLDIALPGTLPALHIHQLPGKPVCRGHACAAWHIGLRCP